uniref:E3 ubiquitin-protein ligase RNF181 n=1 Tax=Anolis carolinensis TaxID=28377 RepID=A0A803TJJ8_ANOCA
MAICQEGLDGVFLHGHLSGGFGWCLSSWPSVGRVWMVSFFMAIFREGLDGVFLHGHLSGGFGLCLSSWQKGGGWFHKGSVEKGLKCPVCLLEFEEGEVARRMPCQHLFHSGCLLPWLGKTNSCPLCRHELPTDNQEYEQYKKDKVRREQQAHRLESLHGAMYT